MTCLGRQMAMAPLLLARGLASLCWSQQYRRQVSVSWDLGNASDPMGWSPVAPLSNSRVNNGTLSFTATQQIYTIFGPPISVTAAPMQRVEILMSSDTAGAAKVFWAPAQSGVYGGFQPGDENDFTMVGDGAIHHYFLPIDTSSAQMILQLRIDVPPGATVSIQSVTL